MKLYRLMVSILCMALLMVLWGCFPCVAEILVRDGHVTGGKDIDRKSFTYDFALPAEIKHVKQYKTELISMNLSHVASVLEGFTQKPRSGDSWGIMNSSQWPCTNFCYFEQNGKYACEGSYYYGPSKRMEGKRYEEAINTVSALLKALHERNLNPLSTCIHRSAVPQRRSLNPSHQKQTIFASRISRNPSFRNTTRRKHWA